MKLRIRGNSIRLRVDQQEVDRLREADRIEVKTSFPGGKQLIYILSANESVEMIQADFKEDMLNIEVPRSMIDHWVKTDEVGFDAQINNDTDEGLRILVEKDWQCLKPRIDEDESSLFPNPAAEK